MNPPRLIPSLPSKLLNRALYRPISSSQRQQRPEQLGRLLSPSLRQRQTRQFHACSSVQARKAPSTLDREWEIKKSGAITEDRLYNDLKNHVLPFIAAAVENGVIRVEDYDFVYRLAIYAYIKSFTIEEVLKELGNEAGRIAKGCLFLLRNKDCAVGARRILVNLAYLGEPLSIIFEANELIRLHGRVDERTKQRVRTIAGRGIFPEAATLYARIIEGEDPEQAAAWYERAMDISRPEPRHKTIEASLPLGHMKQHWEHYLGLMSDVMGDKEKAKRAMMIGANKYDQSTACYTLALLAAGEKDYERKEHYLLKAAQDGHTASCRALGEQYTRAFLVKWLAKNKKEVDMTKYVVPPEDKKFAKKFDRDLLQLFAEEWLRIAANQRENEARVRLACLLHMLDRQGEGMKLLKEADEVRSLIHSTTPVQKKVPELMRAWGDKWAGRDALLRWDFSP
ncbi:hypothetical protein KEM56_007864 [Ascosphaera pollenicola]|nr:hypothetical protein KEM56_007864 [Ascosphaera pollenicola]